MFWKLLPIKVVLLWFFLIVGLAAAFYLFGRGVDSAISQQLLNRKLVFTRAGAANISSFFEVFGDSVAVLAQSPSIQNQSENAILLTDAFVEQWRESGLVGGIVLTNSRGVVKLNVNILGNPDIGASLADRDYFLWAKSRPETGEYFIGEAVTSDLPATKGEIIIPVAAPVYRNGVFVGIVAASVRLNTLAQNFLNSMKVSDSTEVYIINQEGEMLYSNLSFLEENPFTGSEILRESLKNALETKEEGHLEVEKHLVAYVPIFLGNQNWLLVKATPTRELGSFTIPIYTRLIILMTLVILSIFLFGAVTIREVRRSS